MSSRDPKTQNHNGVHAGSDLSVALIQGPSGFWYQQPLLRLKAGDGGQEPPWKHFGGNYSYQGHITKSWHCLLLAYLLDSYLRVSPVTSLISLRLLLLMGSIVSLHVQLRDHVVLSQAHATLCHLAPKSTVQVQKASMLLTLQLTALSITVCSTQDNTQGFCLQRFSSTDFPSLIRPSLLTLFQHPDIAHWTLGETQYSGYKHTVIHRTNLSPFMYLILSLPLTIPPHPLSYFHTHFVFTLSLPTSDMTCFMSISSCLQKNKTFYRIGYPLLGLCLCYSQGHTIGTEHIPVAI